MNACKLRTWWPMYSKYLYLPPFLKANYQPKQLCPRVKRNPNNKMYFSCFSEEMGVSGGEGEEENSQRFCNVSEKLKSKVVLAWQLQSPFPFADKTINAWELNWSAHPPVLFFSQIHHLKGSTFFPPDSGCHPGAVLSSEHHMWLCFLPPSHF